MKKTTLLPLILSAMMLAACSSPSSSSAPAESSSAPAATSSAAATSYDYPVKITFDYNYDGAPAPVVVNSGLGAMLEMPETPRREGYRFFGWVKSLDNQIFDFEIPVLEHEDFTLSALWLASDVKENVFEAEYCPCITDGQGMQGSTYSGGTLGKGLISEDLYGDYVASNDFYVHYLYNNGNTLTFDIVSDKAVEGAILMLRLSGEYRETFTINADKWHVRLNATEESDKGINYKPITFKYIPPQGGGGFPFTDYVISNVNLVEGNNKIELITDNTELMLGTAYSTAPMVDALKLYSTSTLTWPTEKQSNID